MKSRNRGGGALAWLLRVVLVLGILGVFLLEPFDTGSTTTETATITSYDSQMVLTENGRLTTDENLVVALPSGKRGIFRIFDTADPRREGIEHPVTIESIERDGRTEPYQIIDSASGTLTARIGDVDTVLIAGEHDYRILSTTTGALEPGGEGETLWWWDIVGQGWQMPMQAVDVTAQLPTEPLSARCVQGEDTPCTASIEGTTLRVRTGPLEPFTAVTVKVAFPADALPAPPAGEQSSNTLTIILSILAAAVAAGLGLYLYRGTREQEPGFPVLFEPPAGIFPALGVKVLDETESSADLQATLFDLGERGILQLAGDDEQWSVTMAADPAIAPQWPAETAMLQTLGLTHQGATFVVAGNKAAGETIGEAKNALRSNVDIAASQFLSRSGAGWLAWLLGWLCTIAAIVMIGIYFFGDGGWVAWPLLIGTGIFSLIALGMMFDPGVVTKRTATGRDVWSRTGGFARFLTTDSAESRFEAAKHLDWYPKYLAWALALGSADAWAQRYESQGVQLPVVPWILWAGTGQNFSMDRMNDSFNASIASASAAYAASQASSGSGGFSGGSGGGGGGGGSW